jgi:hypothetical protein
VVRHLPQCRDRAPLVAPGFTDTQFVIGCDGWLFVWDAEAAVTGIDSVRTPFPAIEQLATNRAMRRVAVSHDREVAVIDLSNGDVRTAIAHLSNVQVLAFAESGGDLVSAGVDGIWLWAEDLVHRRRLVGPHIGYPSLAAVGGPGSVVTVAGEHGINTWSDSLPSDGPSLCRLAGRFRRH